jgi:hypothetical protein
MGQPEQPLESAGRERASQSGDGERAVCHVCDRELPTQEELLAHLEAEHGGELLT